MLPDNDERRPLAGAAPNVIVAGDITDSTPRCCICGHVVTSVVSIELGIGRDCRRRLRGDRQVVA